MSATDTIVQTIVAYIEQHHLLPEQGIIVVAVSGGADSLCLLHVLHQLCGAGKRYPTVQIHIAHLDHQLRGEVSRQDAEAVARLAESWGLPITLGSTDVYTLARVEQRSLEDAARTARYCFLRKVAQQLTYLPDKVPIAVAHHIDDQVETLLLHCLRGGGIASMVGLQPRQHDIIRPLLCVTHADTLAYCQHHALVPLEDASNVDPHFLRNRIRHELVPLLESLNPGIRATLLRTSEVMGVDSDWIEAQIDACWPSIVIDEQAPIRLYLPPLLALPLSLQRHLLRRVTSRLNEGQSPLELRHYKLIEQLTNGTLHLPHNIHVTRNGDEMIFATMDNHTRKHELVTEQEALELPLPGCIDVPGTPWRVLAELVPRTITQEARKSLLKEEWETVWHILSSTQNTVYIDADKVDCPFSVRTRRPGDRIQPLGMMHEKKVQDVLVDKHITRAERASIPLFFSASHCIWIGGVCLDHRVRLTHETQRIIRLSLLRS